MKTLLVLVLTPFVTSVAKAEPACTIAKLRCEYRALIRWASTIRLPRLAVDQVMQSDRRGERQTAYRVLAASSREKLAAGQVDLWDSGKVASAETAHAVYSGKPLTSRISCYWKVMVWDKDGNPSAWSPPAMWTMGLLDPPDWRAQWIFDRAHAAVGPSARPYNGYHSTFISLPATMLRKEFSVAGPVRRATAYVTGLGLYELRLNGRRVGDQLLTPEWTVYTQRVQYQTYDVTGLVKPGANAVGALLSEGWYAGPLMTKPAMADPSFRLLMRLDVELADGRSETIVTDPTWQSTERGPLRKAGIYFGEVYDATREMPGWDQAGFKAAGWRPVATAAIGSCTTVDGPAQRTDPRRNVRRTPGQSRSPGQSRTFSNVLTCQGQRYGRVVPPSRQRSGGHADHYTAWRDAQSRRHSLHGQSPQRGAVRLVYVPRRRGGV